MKLLTIEKNGKIESEPKLSETAQQVVLANLDNYKKNGFEKPWCAYLAVVNKTIIGTCAFKTPPREGKVEIAYFTFPEFEGQGYATQMATALLQLAKSTNASVRVIAQTLPQQNASTHILSKLKFTKTGTVNHPEDGEVWEWELL